MKIIRLLLGALLLSLALASPSWAQEVTKYEKVPKKTKKTPQQELDERQRIVEDDATREADFNRTFSFCEYYKNYKQQPISPEVLLTMCEWDEAMPICDARAEDAKKLIAEGRLAELVAERKVRREQLKPIPESEQTPEAMRAYKLALLTMDDQCDFLRMSRHLVFHQLPAEGFIPPPVDYSPLESPKHPSAVDSLPPNPTAADIEREAESERLRQLEQRQTDLEIQQKREKH
jgi:hypothetical protein